MDINQHTSPAKLEYYSFIWSEVRMVLAAVALLLGGYPPILYLFPVAGMYGILSLGLKLAWLISGVVAIYLLYLWYTGGMRVFGGTDMKDRVAFLIMSITGINLGLTGLLGQNPGMTVFSGTFIFVVGALIYLAAAAYLYKRWNESGKRLF